MVIELRLVQFWFEITRMISDQIALHSVQLPLYSVPNRQALKVDIEFTIVSPSIRKIVRLF